ncbi:MAG: peroxiredoxin [Vicinamibacteria bacterium]
MAILLALALFLAADAAPVKLNAGDDAPAFALTASNGKTVRLADYKGKKKVVLAFFPKAFSGGCAKEMAAFRDQQAAFDAQDTQILAISLDDLDTQKKFAESLKLTFPVLSDKGGRAATAYGVKGAMWAARTNFVIDESGKIIAIFAGKEAIDPGLPLSVTKRKAS